jgi:hypothetical protein
LILEFKIEELVTVTSEAEITSLEDAFKLEANSELDVSLPMDELEEDEESSRLDDANSLLV